jgi:ATP-dependent helicase/nuclease subunit A
MNLHGLSWEEPAGLGLKATELAYLDAERRRVIYVAATRARDLLVIPRAGAVAPDRHICADLLAGADLALMREMDTYRDGSPPGWAQQVPEPIHPSGGDATEIDREVASRWATACAEAARPRYRPASVSGEADAIARGEAGEQLEPAGGKPREGRFGHLFGSTVHHALGLALRNPELTVDEAVRSAAERLGLVEHVEEAVADVTRALDALRSEGLLRPLGPDLQIEYPVASGWEGGQLLRGYIDLVAATPDRLDVIDLKTDVPPAGPVEAAYPKYASQVRVYGELLEAAGVAHDRRLRCGLLFAPEGVIRWLSLPEFGHRRSWADPK